MGFRRQAPLITGLLNNRSIAYGIAQACHREGAELAFSYQGERFQSERITEFAAEFGSTLTFDCDVGDDAQIDAVLRARQELGQFDGFVHSIGFAPREAIGGDFLDGLSRENFRIATTSRPTVSRRWPAVAALPARAFIAADAVVPGRGALRAAHNTMGLVRPRWRPACATWRTRWAHAASASTACRPGRSDAGRLGHQGFRQAAGRLRRDDADPLRHHDRGTSATPPPSCCPTWPRASAPRSPYVDGGFSHVMAKARTPPERRARGSSERLENLPALLLVLLFADQVALAQGA